MQFRCATGLKRLSKKLPDAPGLSGGDSRWVLPGVNALIGDATALRGGVSRLVLAITDWRPR